MELKICHMYPDVLNLYGDGGNIICMKKRLSWRGIEANVTKLPIGERADLAGFDIVFIGGSAPRQGQGDNRRDRRRRGVSDNMRRIPDDGQLL